MRHEMHLLRGGNAIFPGLFLIITAPVVMARARQIFAYASRWNAGAWWMRYQPPPQLRATPGWYYDVI